MTVDGGVDLLGIVVVVTVVGGVDSDGVVVVVIVCLEFVAASKELVDV